MTVLTYSLRFGSVTAGTPLSVYIISVFVELGEKSKRFFSIIGNDIILTLIFSLFCILIGWMIFIAYLFPSYTWDALWYHLPIVGYIMQNGAVQELANNSFIEQFINIFPKNIELFFLWNIIFLKSDVLIDLSQMLFTLVGVLAVFSMAIKLEIREEYAMYAALLFFFTPVIILQSTTNYVDIAISVLFLAALNFLISNCELTSWNSVMVINNIKQRKMFLLLGGLTTGILLGAKGSGPLFLVILSALVMIQKVRKYMAYTRNPDMLKEYIARKVMKSYLIYFIVPAVMMGGYWYMKNWVLYDNPVYPMDVSIMGKVLFKGLYKDMIEPVPDTIKKLSFFARPIYVWMEHIEFYLYDSRLGGLGPIWFILFIPSLVFSTLHALKNRKYQFLAVVAIIMTGFFIYPRHWTPRYVIFIVGLGALSFAYIMDFFYVRDRIIRLIVLLLTAYTFLTVNSPCVTPAQIKHFVNLPASERTIARHAPYNIDIHARQEYGHWIWISDNIKTGETLAYTFEPLFLSPLWNSGFSNSIIYIKAESYNEWLKDLEMNMVSYVLVRTKSKEDKWVEASYSLIWMGMRERFNVEYADDHYKIIRFLK
ncbi:MAG: hypothetical protein JSW20_00385 [Nitrospiraceae bacterium]|nr:MAG: hypothetical protein JSW20_00385 [Nitrospiraceae bacterium]